MSKILVVDDERNVPPGSRKYSARRGTKSSRPTVPKQRWTHRPRSSIW